VAYLALDRDVAISLRLLGTLSGLLVSGFVSLSAGGDPLGPVYTARARRAQTRASQWERFVPITPQSR